MSKKVKFSVHFHKEYIVVAEDYDQAILKTQQFLNIPMNLFKTLNVDATKLDMDYEKLCERTLYDGVDIK